MSNGSDVMVRDVGAAEILAPLPAMQDPDRTIAEATKAATALQQVVARKTDPVMVNGKQYLEFEDWQTLGHFYGVHVRTRDAEPVTINGIEGARARADVLNASGQIIGGAEAVCLRDEEQWGVKPWFQLASMAQTRAGAKALRNVLAWVAVLAGYKPTPAEEMQGITSTGPTKPSMHFQPDTPYTGILVDYTPAVQVPKGQKGNKPQKLVVDVDGSELVIGGFDLPDGLLAPVVWTWKGERVTVSYVLDKSGKWKNLKSLARAAQEPAPAQTEPAQELFSQPSEAMAPYLDKLRLCESHKEVSGVIREYQKDTALSSDEKAELTKAATVKLKELEEGQG